MRLAFALALCFTLNSCGLIALPFKVAGKVVGGTAKLGKTAYNASVDTFRDNDEPEKKPEKSTKTPPSARPPATSPDLLEPSPSPLPTPPPSADTLPPLPPVDLPSY